MVCQQCGQTLKVPAKLTRKRARCSVCKSYVDLPPAVETVRRESRRTVPEMRVETDSMDVRSATAAEELPPATCNGESLPKAVTKGIDAARTALGKAQTASAKAARRLEKQAAARLKKAAAKLAKAAKQDKVGATCATDLGASIEELRALIAQLLAG